jgi:hypothetical protein
LKQQEIFFGPDRSDRIQPTPHPLRIISEDSVKTRNNKPDLAASRIDLAMRSISDATILNIKTSHNQQQRKRKQQHSLT